MENSWGEGEKSAHNDKLFVDKDDNQRKNKRKCWK